MKSGAEIYFAIHFAVLLSLLLDIFSSDEKVKRRAILFWCSFFTLFGGLRWQVGGDWEQYYWHFRHSEFSNVFSYIRYGDRKLEWGFVLLNASIKFLFGKFFIYNLIICGFIQYTRYKVSILLCKDYALTAYCMLTLLSVHYFAKRAELSVAICLWLFIFIKSSKIKKFLPLNYLAFIIHHQSLIMLPMYWIGKIKLKWYYFIALLVISSVAVFYFQNLFINTAAFIGGDVSDVALHYTEYQTEGREARGVSTLLLNIFLASVFLWVRKESGKEKDFWYNALLNMFLIQTAMYMVFSEGMDDLTRLGTLLLFAKILLIINVIRFAKEKRYTIVHVLAWLFIIAYLGQKASKVDSWYYFYEANVPYKTIFDYRIYK
jgi:phosphate/sulfate permease